ncbi:MAG: aminoacyl-tRNA hydrolase [Hyphomicrobiales bacterium]
MILLAGLGNPGTKYAANRHNIGFMAVDEIAARHGFSPWRKRFRGEISEGRLGSQKVLLLKPQTFMNESGRSVGEAMKFYKLAPEDVFVFHDELDLAPGKVRCKQGGGLAGHNGLKSIAAHIGKDFNRVRLGIGHPGNKSKVHSWVLKDFSKAERAWLDALVDAIGNYAGLLVDDDAASFQNKVHLAVNPDAETKPEKPEAPKKPAPKISAQQTREEKSGPFADALKKLFSKNSNA